MNEQLKRLIGTLYGIDTRGLSDEEIKARVRAADKQKRSVAEIRPATVDMEARTVEVVIATEEPVRVVASNSLIARWS